MEKYLEAIYTSVWDGLEVNSKCKVNLADGTIFDIEENDYEGDDGNLSTLDREYISLPNVKGEIHIDDLKVTDKESLKYLKTFIRTSDFDEYRLSFLGKYRDEFDGLGDVRDLSDSLYEAIDQKTAKKAFEKVSAYILTKNKEIIHDLIHLTHGSCNKDIYDEVLSLYNIELDGNEL